MGAPREPSPTGVGEGSPRASSKGLSTTIQNPASVLLLRVDVGRAFRYPKDMRVDPIHVRAALASGRQRDPLGIPVKREAAVALVLNVGPPDTEVLLIRRAERVGDPWSGHMALPGGHTEPEDEDSRATAVRETFEEVGVLLDEASHLGSLSQVPAMVRGTPTGTLITPHVFLLPRPVPLRPNHEVAEVFWAPLGPMARGQYDTIKVVEREGRRLEFPAIRVDRHLVWGLTHRMLSELFSVLRTVGRRSS